MSIPEDVPTRCTEAMSSALPRMGLRVVADDDLLRRRLCTKGNACRGYIETDAATLERRTNVLQNAAGDERGANQKFAKPCERLVRLRTSKRIWTRRNVWRYKVYKILLVG